MLLSVNAKASLTASVTARAVTKVGVSDPAVCDLDVGSSHPGAEFGPKGSAVRRLKWYASWVQNVARQFGPYLSWAKDI